MVHHQISISTLNSEGPKLYEFACLQQRFWEGGEVFQMHK